jgi:hypothetical protein
MLVLRERDESELQELIRRSLIIVFLKFFLTLSLAFNFSSAYSSPGIQNSCHYILKKLNVIVVY